MKRMGVKRRVMYATIVVALVMVLVILPVSAVEYQMVSQGCIGYQYGDLPGMPVYTGRISCRDMCKNRDDCKFVTWGAPKTSRNDGTVGVCWLKSSAGTSVIYFGQEDCDPGRRPDQYPETSEAWEKQVQAPVPGPQVVEVVPQPAVNQKPVAIIAVDKSTGQLPLTINVDGGSSHDPDGSISSYAWDFGDGSTAFWFTSTAQHTYVTPGTFVASLVVTDNNGLPSNPATIAIIVQSTAQVKTTGSLSVSSTPSGASVYIDTVYQGTTPVTIPQLAPGSHTVQLTLTGYTDYSGRVTVTAGPTSHLNIPLTQNPSPSITIPTSSGSIGSTIPTSSGSIGSLQISTNPSGATIILDGRNKGNTPATFSDLSTGSHKINFTKSGYWDFSQDITVAAGKTTPVNVNLVARLQPSPSPTGSIPIPTPYQPGSGGSIIITSNPSGANVYLDGKTSGTTPLTLQNVNPGTHTILLTMQGYTDASRTVDVAEGAQDQISVDMIKGKKTPGFETVLAVLSIAGLVAIRMFRRKEE
jgi:PKD repeat protein